MKNRLQQLLAYLEENPDDTFLNHAAAMELLKSNQHHQALEYFQKVLQNDPMYVGTYYQLAKLYEMMDDLDEARKTYVKGMEVAEKLNERKTYNELWQAYQLIEE